MRWHRTAVAAAVVTGGALAVVALRWDGGPAGQAAEPADPAAVSAPLGDQPGSGVAPRPLPTALGRLQPAIDAGQALVVLAGLPVSAELLVGHDRDSFGAAWTDVDANGCNQRDDVLLRDAVPTTARTAPQGACDHDVIAGSWLDPYTGRMLTFDDLKDEAQAQAIPIDHLVPLSEAHRSGAAGWTPERRLAFANDLGNLVAVGGSANSAKGDGDPPRWLPPDLVRCAYATAWVDVKSRWLLTVDAAERAVLSDLLAGC